MRIYSSVFIFLLTIFSMQLVSAENTRCVPCPLTATGFTGPVANFCNVNISNELCVGDAVNIQGDLNVCGRVTASGPLIITNTTQSTNCSNGALVVNGGVGVGRNLNVCGNATFGSGITGAGPVVIINTTASNGCTNGALVVAGGVGIGGNLNVCGTGTFNSPVVINNTTESLGCSEGALIVIGGVGIGGNLNVCGSITATGGIAVTGPLIVDNRTQSTNCTNGALVVPLGGVGIGGNLNVCGQEHIFNTTPSTGCSNGALVVNGGVGIGGDLNVCGEISAASFSGPGLVVSPTGLVITATGNSTNCTNGALVVDGGVGIVGNLNVCGNEHIFSTSGSSGCTSGALIVDGGLGVGGDINACGFINNNADFRQNGITILVEDTSNRGNLSVGFNAANVGNGDGNVAVGPSALSSNISGTDNVAIGQEALRFLTLNNNLNVGIGFQALRSYVGSQNTVIGSQAMENGSGSSNIAIGANAGTSYFAGTQSNNILIANNGVANDQGQIRIGTLNSQTGCFIQGINGVTVAGGTTVIVGANGQLGTVVSSRRFKKDITDMKDQSDKIHELRPVEFVFTNDANNTKQYGLIAEEVANVYPEMIAYDAEGRIHTVQYMQLIPVLLQQIQALTKRVEIQEKLNS